MKLSYYNSVILAVFCISFSFPVFCLAQPDRNAYLWKQGTLQTVNRGMDACNASIEAVNRYLQLASLAEPQAAFIFRDFAEYKQLTIEEFQVAAQHFAEAIRHYKEALATFEDAYQQYEKVRFSASRATDETLNRYRSSIVKRQFKDATVIYRNAKEIITLGNRAFNAGNRYFNEGVDKALLRQEEDEGLLKKRYKFHTWPSPN